MANRINVNERLTFRVNEADKERIFLAASAERLCPATFVRRQIMKTVAAKGF
jgi:hypothetical protein